MEKFDIKKLLPIIIIIPLIILVVISTTKCSVFQKLRETPTFTLTNTIPPTSTFTSEPTSTPVPSATPTSTFTYTATPAYEAIVTALILNARSGPGTNFDIITELQLDTVLVVLTRSLDNEWFQVILPNSESLAWVWIGGISYDFDNSVIPTITETPSAVTATTQPSTYGSAILAPPNLPGISPSAPINPSRRLLASISFGFLALIMIYTWISNPRIKNYHKKTSSLKIFEVINSLF
jgi:hypothetical protein